MDYEKCKKAMVEARKIDPSIDGWDQDNEAQTFWATYPTDGPLGKIIAVNFDGEIIYS